MCNTLLSCSQNVRADRLNSFKLKLMVLWSPEYAINEFHCIDIFNVNISNSRWEMSALGVCFQLRSSIYDK